MANVVLLWWVLQLSATKKDEKAVNLLCDTLLDASPGLATGIKVLRADVENSILNQTWNAFSCAMLLLCIKHVEENIKRNLPKTISENKRNNILSKYLEHTYARAWKIVKLHEFDKKFSVFFEELSMDEELKEFSSYFKKQNENTIKYT